MDWIDRAIEKQKEMYGKDYSLFLDLIDSACEAEELQLIEDEFRGD